MPIASPVVSNVMKSQSSWASEVLKSFSAILGLSPGQEGLNRQSFRRVAALRRVGTQSRKHRVGAIGNTIGDTKGNTIASSVGNSIANAIGDTIGNTVANSIGNSTANAIGNTIGNAIGNTIGNAIGNSIGNTIDNTIGNSIGNSIKSNIYVKENNRLCILKDLY